MKKPKEFIRVSEKTVKCKHCGLLISSSDDSDTILSEHICDMHAMKTTQLRNWMNYNINKISEREYRSIEETQLSSIKCEHGNEIKVILHLYGEYWDDGLEYVDDNYLELQGCPICSKILCELD